MTDLYIRYQSLIGREHAVREGLELLEQAEKDLANDARRAEIWGNIAVFAHATLIPLNAVINSLQLGKAKSAYEAVVRAVYNQVGASGKNYSGGTKTEKIAKSFLKSVKEIAIEELKRKGLTDHIPGVNVLVGFAEDAIALVQVSSLVQANDRETSSLKGQMQRKIAEAKAVLAKMGVERATLMEQGQRRAKTA